MGIFPRKILTLCLWESGLRKRAKSLENKGVLLYILEQESQQGLKSNYYKPSTGFKGGVYLIELQTGKIVFPELDITLQPFMHYSDFITVFPKDKIIHIRDMRTGYIWYDLREKVCDNKIPVQLCFNPQEKLEFVQLYPQYYDPNNIPSWENWTPKAAQEDKKYCDEWLVRFCGLHSEENFFPWGSIASYYDPRSVGSGIYIHYTQMAKKEM